LYNALVNQHLQQQKKQSSPSPDSLKDAAVFASTLLASAEYHLRIESKNPALGKASITCTPFTAASPTAATCTSLKRDSSDGPIELESNALSTHSLLPLHLLAESSNLALEHAQPLSSASSAASASSLAPDRQAIENSMQPLLAASSLMNNDAGRFAAASNRATFKQPPSSMFDSNVDSTPQSPTACYALSAPSPLSSPRHHSTQTTSRRFAPPSSSSLSSNATPLHQAILAGDLAQCTELLQRDRSLIMSRDCNGCTPLHIAIQADHMQIVHLLLGIKLSLINVRDCSGQTALHYAAMYNRTAALALMFDKQATSDDAHAPNSLAASTTEVIDIDTDSKDYRGQTPLHLAVLHGHVQAVLMLLRNRACPNAISAAGDCRSAIHLATNSCSTSTDILQALIEFKADLNARENTLGLSPLHLAAVQGNAAHAKLLLHYRADHRLQDYRQRTALQVALEGSHMQLADLLCEQQQS
jgi:ankyrin repeat protein